jgi:cytochrome c peroxidase
MRLRTAHTLSEVTDRAAIVRATGVLGESIRRAVRAEGFVTTSMIRPLRNVQEVDALTLPRPAVPPDPARAALGARLFFDRGLSRGKVRACATCHVPERAFSDGLVAPVSLDPALPLRRNTPTLLYAPLEALLTWDGRVRTADRQALMVIHTRAEMGLTEEDLTRAVASDTAYAEGFRSAFHEEVTQKDVGLAFAAYESSVFVPGNAPIDRLARGDADALSPDAKLGLDVFAGKGRCARCHVPPVFGGTRPPDFTAPIFAVLGVPSTPDAKKVDADPGRGGAFKVPTVRNAGRTAPYFHNGRYATLEAVVDFYDRGGGRGLGLDVPNQDPEIRPLHLSADEKRVLLVFMRDALDDPPDDGKLPR